MKIKRILVYVFAFYALSCSNNEQIPKQENLNTELNTKLMQQMDKDFEAYLNGLQEVFAHTSIDKFFDKQLFDLVKLDNKTSAELMLIDGHIDTGLTLIKKKLSKESTIALNRVESGMYDEITKEYYFDLKSYVARGVICNEEACANSVALLADCGGCNAITPGCCAFAVGIAVHCCDD